MPRKEGSIGSTKLKILAIIHYYELSEITPYGYNIWLKMRDKFHLYLEKENLRNVYRHLKDLHELKYIDRGSLQFTGDAPGRRPYCLTEQGMMLKEKFTKYLEILDTG